MHTIFLSTQGKNELEVPKELVNFLKYVTAPLEQSEQNFHDEYIERLQRAVREVKQRVENLLLLMHCNLVVVQRKFLKS